MDEEMDKEVSIHKIFGCSKCHQPLSDSFLGCPNCNVVLYCSPSCQALSISDHQKYCKPVQNKQEALNFTSRQEYISLCAAICHYWVLQPEEVLDCYCLQRVFDHTILFSLETTNNNSPTNTYNVVTHYMQYVNEKISVTITNTWDVSLCESFYGKFKNALEQTPKRKGKFLAVIDNNGLNKLQWSDAL